jgi:hypothetical protein
MIQIKNIVYNYNNALDSNPASSTTGTILFHRISFADDTLFPQMFESTPTSTNDISIDNGKTLPARPTTLTINKIQSNNTLVLALHSLNDKYLLTGDLKGSAKPAANSTADNAEFSLTGKININKNKSYPVVASLTETKSKEMTQTDIAHVAKAFSILKEIKSLKSGFEQYALLVMSKDSGLK